MWCYYKYLLRRILHSKYNNSSSNTTHSRASRLELKGNNHGSSSNSTTFHSVTCAIEGHCLQRTPQSMNRSILSILDTGTHYTRAYTFEPRGNRKGYPAWKRNMYRPNTKKLAWKINNRALPLTKIFGLVQPTPSTKHYFHIIMIPTAPPRRLPQKSTRAPATKYSGKI